MMRVRATPFSVDLGLMAVVALLCLGLGAALVASAALRPQAPSERGVAPMLDVPSNPPAPTAAPLLQLPAEPPAQNAQPSTAPSPVPAGAPEQPQGGSGATQPGSGSAPKGPAGPDPRQKFDEPNDPPIQGVKPIYIGEDK